MSSIVSTWIGTPFKAETKFWPIVIQNSNNEEVSWLMELFISVFAIPHNRQVVKVSRISDPPVVYYPGRAATRVIQEWRSGGGWWHQRTDNVIGQFGRDAEKLTNPVIAVIILDWESSQEEWPLAMVEEMRKRSNYYLRVYRVIMDQRVPGDKNAGAFHGHFWFSELPAMAKEAGYMHYHSHAKQVAARRLAELCRRLLGYDLPGNRVPGYSLAELRQLLWYLNRENFNLQTPPADAVVKYDLSGGRPDFRVGEATLLADCCYNW